MSTPPPADRIREALRDEAFPTRFRANYRGRHDANDVLMWWAAGSPLPPEDADLVARLRIASFSRPAAGADTVAAAEELRALEQILTQDLRDAEHAFTMSDRTEPAMDGREADIAEDPSSTTVRPSRPLLRRSVLVSAAAGLLVLIGGWAAAALLVPAPNPLAVFAAPASPPETTPRVFGSNLTDIHDLGEQHGWKFYAAHGRGKNVCLFVARAGVILGPSCADEVEFRIRGVAMSAQLDAETYEPQPQTSHATVFVFIWDEDGEISIER